LDTSCFPLKHKVHFLISSQSETNYSLARSYHRAASPVGRPLICGFCFQGTLERQKSRCFKELRMDRPHP